MSLKGLSDGLTGNRVRQGQASRVQRGLGARCTRLLRAGVHVVGMREQDGNDRGAERGMPEGFQRARLFGVERVPPVDRCLQPDAQFDLHAHTGEVGDRPRSDPRGEIGPEAAVPCGALDSDQAHEQRRSIWPILE